MKWTEFSCILKPSTVSGIGVFATHDIPAGTRIFEGLYVSHKANANELPADFIKYCIFLNDEECLRPARFDRMEIGWYINHSYTPNIIKQAGDYALAARDIKAGEEFFIDYNQLNEPEHIKEPYYKKI
jgi:SET domain-containing protein